MRALESVASGFRTLRDDWRNIGEGYKFAHKLYLNVVHLSQKIQDGTDEDLDSLRILTELGTYKIEIAKIVQLRDFDDRIAAGVAIYARFHPKHHDYLERYYDYVVSDDRKIEKDLIIDV